MKKADIKHGAVFAIPLWKDLGFFYGKMLWGKDLKNEFVRKEFIFIRVYDFYSKEIITDFPPDFFKGLELFVDPFILNGFPNIKGKDSWKFIRHDPTFDEDEFIPHYWNPGMLGQLEFSPDEIFRVVKYGNVRFDAATSFFPYYRINHLPIFRTRNSLGISLYLTFDWLKRNGQDVDAPFEYDNEGLDPKKEVRFEVTHYAHDYRTIPRELRGRVAPEIINPANR